MNSEDSNVLVKDFLGRVIPRDLAALRREVQAYPDDESLWRVVPGITNSAGNLALHVAGNLKHFIGATLGNTGYIRDRDAEFSTRGLTRNAVSRELDETEDVVIRVLTQMQPDRLLDEYPIAVNGFRAVTGAFLIHLAVHLGYHLGQVDYHRRIMCGSAETVDTIGLQAAFGNADVTNA